MNVETLREELQNTSVLLTREFLEGRLRQGGSVAAPGFMRPEGYCVYIPATGSIFKNPFDK